MAADKQRGKQSVRDMVISLAVILLAAWVIYLFVPHDEHQDPVRPVGYGVELSSARRAAPYQVAAPQGLAKGWRATSVTYEGEGDHGAAWHLGFIAPDGEYAAVEQSDVPRPAAYLQDVTHGARKTGGTRRADGAKWTRYEGAKYDALVREGPAGKVTTVVTGTASFERLGELAGALEYGKSGDKRRNGEHGKHGKRGATGGDA